MKKVFFSLFLGNICTDASFYFLSCFFILRSSFGFSSSSLVSRSSTSFFLQLRIFLQILLDLIRAFLLPFVPESFPSAYIEHWREPAEVFCSSCSECSCFGSFASSFFFFNSLTAVFQNISLKQKSSPSWSFIHVIHFSFYLFNW